ncbi:hypothetical protein ANN_01163 [Periplaneta americana]|uniref:Uncharacterized protein n=1 Tax=Periplaneta americana TaxID=6978 RepID=A0ABQ8TSX8_PERAM|nr:hypothetical protein ANN_01163 [Periplaneta americana]
MNRTTLGLYVRLAENYRRGPVGSEVDAWSDTTLRILTCSIRTRWAVIESENLPWLTENKDESIIQYCVVKTLEIIGYDYSGYGVSTGKPSEKNLYADIDAAWHALRTRYGISPENIILYGQSIGTVPTVDLASRYEVGAVILHSPLMSGMRVAFPNTKRTWFFDAFPSNDSTALVYCMNGHRYDERFVRRIIKKSGCVRVACWGWISYDGAGLLERIHRQFTAEVYEHILANVMIPSAQKQYPEGTLFFQQDNHPIHTANQIQRWFTRRRDVDPVD